MNPTIVCFSFFAAAMAWKTSTWFGASPEIDRLGQASLKQPLSPQPNTRGREFDSCPHELRKTSPLRKMQRHFGQCWMMMPKRRRAVFADGTHIFPIEVLV